MTLTQSQSQHERIKMNLTRPNHSLSKNLPVYVSRLRTSTFWGAASCTTKLWNARLHIIVRTRPPSLPSAPRSVVTKHPHTSTLATFDDSRWSKTYLRNSAWVSLDPPSTSKSLIALDTGAVREFRWRSLNRKTFLLARDSYARYNWKPL